MIKAILKKLKCQITLQFLPEMHQCSLNYIYIALINTSHLIYKVNFITFKLFVTSICNKFLDIYVTMPYCLPILAICCTFYQSCTFIIKNDIP